MALKPKIFKCKIQLSDMDRHVYGEYPLVLAQHPSETIERLCTRLLAFCLNADEQLKFTGGLSVEGEPELWLKNDHGGIEQWIDVGQPEPERLKKAQRQSQLVKVYCFGKSGDTWWQLNKDKLNKLDRVEVIRFDWDLVSAIAGVFYGGCEMVVSISDAQAFISIDEHSFELTPQAWQ